MNNEGQAVGFATLPGEVMYHATLWTQVGKMTDLGTLGNDPCSVATGINASGQVVGSSFDCNSNFRAFLWEDGSLFDLNALIPAGSSLSVTQTYTINNRGEIAGEGRDGSGHDHALLLIPCDENHADVHGCDFSMVDEAAAGSNSSPMTDELAAATSTQPLTSSEIVTPWRTRMLRGFHIPGASFPRRVTVTDSQSPAVQKITITSGTPPRGTVGKAYDMHCHIPFCGGSIVVGFPLGASGGVLPYSWAWTPQPGSSLPPSLSISHHFGLHGCVSLGSGYGICGTPTTAGNYNVTVKVTDSASPPAHASANYTIDID
jgi:probable HAF family extracellular repeat protein